jgi:serine/threonine protein kinase
MSFPTDLGDLNTADWNHINELVNQFERECQDRFPVDLGKYLPPVKNHLYCLILEELVKSDLEIQRQKGQNIRLEAYLSQYPHLQENPKTIPRLLLEEYKILLKHGDKPDLEQFRKRFPKHYTDLKILLDDTTDATNQVTPVPVVPLSVPSRNPEKGEQLAVGGGYTLLKVLGQGQFGKVWRAEAPGGKLVALKVISWPLDHPAAQRELQSLEVIKHINHPYLLDIHSFYAQDDRLIVIMGLADCSLKQWLDQCKKEGFLGIPFDQLLLYMRESAEVLDYLHQRKIQHRDIKPGNILLSSGHVRVGDLGLARLIQDHMQNNASILGTPPYMAPETWLEKVHDNSDQYSLAVTYIELRRGKCPFNKGNVQGLMPKHLDDAPGLASLSKEEMEVLLRAGDKDPENRWPSCKAFVEALEEALTPKKSIGYRKVEWLGRGVAGDVWRGEAPGGKAVAIKVIPLADKDKAENELQALEWIKDKEHPHLVTIFAFWLEKEELNIAMTLAEGNLADRLKEIKRTTAETAIPVDELLEYMLQAAHGLDYLHEHNIIHHDVKPANILLRQRIVKVADFGLARMLEHQKLNASGASGTMAYMPPEVWEGKSSIHSDQYSLAATYVELRLGRSLFASRSIAALKSAHQHELPDLSSLPESEQEVLLKALAKDPDDRYSSCMEFVQALVAAIRPNLQFNVPGVSSTLMPWASTVPSTAPLPPTTTTWQPVPKPANRTGLILGIALLVLLAGGGLFWLSRQSTPTPPFRLIVPSNPVRLAAGEAATIHDIHIIENKDLHEVDLKWDPVNGIIVAATGKPASSGQTEIPFSFTVRPDALPGPRQLVLRAYSDGEEVESKTLTLVVSPLRTLPVNSEAGIFRPVVEPDGKIDLLAYPPGDKAAKQYYQRIELLAGDPDEGQPIAVRFALVHPRPENLKKIQALKPFYIMEDMVWQDLYALYVKSKGTPDEVAHAARMVALSGSSPQGRLLATAFTAGQPGRLFPGNGRLPALGVNYPEAHQFAAWLGGKLPSLAQWDLAAGKYETKPPRPGPFRPDWPLNDVTDSYLARDSLFHAATLGIGILPARDPGYLIPWHSFFDLRQGIAANEGLSQPLPVGTAPWDISPYGCRDMSGNGFEWTRSTKSGDFTLPLQELTPVMEFYLRSQKFACRLPYFFDDPNYYFRRPIHPPFQAAPQFNIGPDRDRQGYHLRDIGLRVVIE